MGSLIGRFETEDDLRHADYRLTNDIHRLQKQYTEIYNTVEELRNAYYMTQHKLPPERYQYLQDMIKTFINNYEWRRTAATTDSNRNWRSGTRRYRDTAFELAAVKREVDPLRKADMREDIQKKNRRREQLQNMFVELDSAANALITDYESARHRTPLTKYEAMKGMIKRIIMADNLKPSRFSF